MILYNVVIVSSSGTNSIIIILVIIFITIIILIINHPRGSWQCVAIMCPGRVLQLAASQPPQHRVPFALCAFAEM